MAKIEVTVGAKTTPFTSALDHMRSQAEGFAKHLQGIGARVAGAFALERIFEKAVEKIGAATEEFKEFASEVSRSKALMGETAAEVQRVGYAAKLASADASELEKGMLKIRQAAEDAKKGAPDASEIFSNMGINPSEFAAKNLSEQVLALAAAFDELKKKGDPTLVFLDALGTKNRSLIEMFRNGKGQLTADMAGAPIIGDAAIENQSVLQRRRAERAAALRHTVASDGIVEGMDAWEKIQSGATSMGVKGLAWFGKGLKDVAENIADVTGLQKKERTISTEEALARGIPIAREPLTTSQSAIQKGAALTTSKKMLETFFAPASERAKMMEQQHEAGFRREQGYELDPALRAQAMQAEQRRILQAAMKESDPKAALSLLLKGKGMESEIVSATAAMNAPDTLRVSAGRLAEMGGGGPVSQFGSLEVKMAEGNSYLREIRDEILRKNGDFIFSAGSRAPDGSINPAGVYPLATVSSQTAFGPKER